MKQYAALDDTVYFWFAANDTSGSGGDGASPAADVRLAGAAADAAPVYSPTPALLSHASYPAGAYEIAIAATAANGFAANNTYAIFCTLAIDAQNPTGFVGSFDLKPVEANVTQLLDTAWLTPGVAGTPDVNAKLLGGTSQTGNDVGADVNSILADTGTTLDALIKDVPTVAEFEARSIVAANYVVVGDTIAGVTAVTNDVGITQAGADKVRASVCVTGDPANSLGKILHEIYTNRLTSARAGYLANIDNANLATIADISSLTSTEIAYLNASISSRSSHTAANVWAVGTRALTDKAGFGLSTAGILAIWHQLTANIVTANTIGKLLKDDINATISSRSSHDTAAVWTAGSRALSTPADYKADISALALEATLTAMKGASFLTGTDSLEALRNRGDSAWITGAGGDATATNQTTIINHLIDVKGTNFVKDTHSLKQILDLIQRTLGLTQENHYIDNTTFTTGKLTAARIRIYSVAGSVGTAADVIATYNIAATYDANGNMETYKVTKA